MLISTIAWRCSHDAAAEGFGGFYVIAAGAGTGKTALLTAGVRQAHRLGFTVLADAASHRDMTPPFGVAARLLGMNDCGNVPASMDDLHQRLDKLVANGPVLVAVDDCQWLERESLEWLCALSTRGGLHRPLAVMLTVSVGEPSRDPELIEELRTLSARPLRLPGLDVEATEKLLSHRLGTVPDASFAAKCGQLTLGNPLLLTLLADAMLDHGVEPTAEHLGSCTRSTWAPSHGSCSPACSAYPRTGRPSPRYSLFWAGPAIST
ncbi:ATP-binding protein [Actinoplanes sp. NPDC089786]|uniref:ATP-binding protein n=1 Tax=Actinoplanes sp. NPDC089786 TaxID=3155185 RepID=UPI0034269DD1